MADFSIGGAIGSGAGMIFRKPLSVLLWGLLPLLLAVAALALFGGALFAAFSTAMRAGAGGATPDSAALGQAIMQGLGGVMAFVVVVWLGAWVMGAMLSGAAFRAVLNPEQNAFGYLRLGVGELMLMLVNFVMGLMFMVAFFVLMIPVSILTGVLAGAGSNGQPNPAALLIVPLGELVVGLVLLFFWLRLSLAGPMSFHLRGFHIFQSWGLTRGHWLKMFLIGVVMVAILIGLEFLCSILGSVGLLVSAGSLQAYQGNPQALFANPGTLFGALGPALAIWAVLYVIFAGMSNAMFNAPLAYIYKSLTQPDVAQTFH